MSKQVYENRSDELGTKPTPGKRLRIAREASGLNLADIAIHLKLDVEKIEDLENDLVDSIVAPVFLAGYLRAYARLLNLPADELIADFEQLTEMTSPSLKPAASSVSSRHAEVSEGLPAHMSLANKGWSGLVIGALFVLVVLVAAWLWWNSQKNTQLRNTPAGNTEVQGAAPGSSQETSSGENMPLSPVSEMSFAAMEKQASPLLMQDKPAHPDSNAETINVEPVTDNTLEDKDLKSSSEPATLPTADSVTEAILPALSPLADEPILVLGKQERLTFLFSDDSWIEVTDATGQRLLYRLGRAGNSVTVSGVAPFKVHLGYQPGVRILLNGDPYGLSRFGDRRTINFQLGVEINQQNNG